MKKISLIFLASIWLAGCSTPALPITRLEEQCLTPQDSYPAAANLSGTLIDNQGQTVLFSDSGMISGMMPHEINSGITEVFSNISVSPDRKKTVYLSTKYANETNEFLGRDLIFVEDGQIKNNIPYWGEQRELIGWLDNNWLLLSPVDLGLGTILFDPASSQSKQIQPDFPSIYSLPPLPLWYKGQNPLPLYNAALSMVFYLQDLNGMMYSLWDITQNRSVWAKRITNPLAGPMWSPDGAWIAFAIPTDNPTQFELFQVNRKGEEIQLTDLDSQFRSVLITDLSWSPDGNLLAVNMDVHENEDSEFNPRLSILDISKGKLTTYCIGRTNTRPVWAPDGQSIAVGVANEQEEGWHTVVINLQDLYAVTISTKGFPVGWIP
jgi:dipeptidyl aminopeptidase/acylaminoacyl peptidase